MKMGKELAKMKGKQHAGTALPLIRGMPMLNVI